METRPECRVHAIIVTSCHGNDDEAWSTSYLIMQHKPYRRQAGTERHQYHTRLATLVKFASVSHVWCNAHMCYWWQDSWICNPTTKKNILIYEHINK